MAMLPGVEQRTAELADGAVVAFFGIGTLDTTRITFVEINVLLNVGHAAHPRCYANSV